MSKPEKNKEEEQEPGARLERMMDTVTLELEIILVLAIHGNLCLALRHPGNIGPSRRMIVDFVRTLGDILVEGKVITPATRRQIETEIHEFE